ncbi:hypothetical protein BDN72DRAFT_904143 [Pluteus cervinus]|uniref:Uncharacterized protein n=1 Tax=Pluteus cervinus TaxID=181527 RepID=A0ACD3A6U5_9AGAR|nr:hypothetical protein BDN72DRAFT_904143 [Pluteus cervinus]
MAFYTDELECRVGYTNEVFSPEQTNEIKRRLTEAVIELEELELNILLYEGQTLISSSSSVSGYMTSTGSCIPRTNRYIDAFAVQSRLLLDRIRRYRIALAPIKSLPAEILSQIFLFTASGHPLALPFSERDPRIVCSRICAFWRTTALRYPALWNDLMLSSSKFAHRQPGPRRDHVAFWVLRSGSSPFSLRIEPAFSARNTLSLVWTPPVLMAFSTRLKKFHVHLSVYQFETLCMLPMNSFERLEEFSLSIMSTKFQQPSGIPMSFNFLALEAITIVGNVTLTLSSLPWAQLRKVDFKGMDAAGGFYLDILGRMPNVEECVFDSVCMRKPYRSLSTSGEIKLTKLKKLLLTFQEGYGYFPFFDRLAVTNLEDLEMEGVQGQDWDQAAFGELLRRSGCRLKRLSVWNTSFESAGSQFPTARILQLNPTLEDVRLLGFSAMDAADWENIGLGILGPELKRLDMSLDMVELLLSMLRLRESTMAWMRSSYAVSRIGEVNVTMHGWATAKQELEILELRHKGLLTFRFQHLTHRPWRQSCGVVCRQYL